MKSFNLFSFVKYINEGMVTLRKKLFYWVSALIIISACVFLVFDTKSPTPLTDKEAVNLSFKLSQSLSNLQSGGDYKEGEYQSFIYENNTYRYLSSSIDSEKEWIQYLSQSMTKEAALRVFQEQNLILQNGKLAQIEADGGSLLEWEKSKAYLINQSGSTIVYKLLVPVGETGETETFQVTFIKENQKVWRITELPTSVN